MKDIHTNLRNKKQIIQKSNTLANLTQFILISIQVETVYKNT